MYTYTYMNITTYIRKEDEHLWNLIENKAQWIHEQLNKLAPTPAHTPAKPQTKKVPAEPVYEEVAEKITAVSAPVPKLNVMTNSDLQALLGGKATPIKDEPRHTCKDNCKHWVWDTNRGGRTNTLTGEFQEGEPW